MIRKASDMELQVRTDMRGGTGDIQIFHCFKKDEMKANCRLCSRLVLTPGTSIGTHQHDAEDEVFIITRGSGMLDDGTTETRVQAGDAILTGNGESHAIRNDGDEDLEIVAVIMCY